MNHSLSLESVASQFASWRATRPIRGLTPVSLQQQVVALKNTYSISQIILTLGINTEALKRWSAKHQHNDNTIFIPLPDEAVSHTPKPSATITCEFPNGIRLTLTDASLSHDVLSTIYHLNSGENNDSVIR